MMGWCSKLMVVAPLKATKFLKILKVQIHETSTSGEKQATTIFFNYIKISALNAKS
jgi:hypothetical protein